MQNMHTVIHCLHNYIFTFINQYIVAPLQDSHCPSFSLSNSQCLDGPVQDFKGGEEELFEGPYCARNFIYAVWLCV